MKIKTFVFRISNWCGQADIGEGGAWGDDFESSKNQLVTAKDIDKEINKFLDTVVPISVSVDHQAVNNHNNGGWNTVIAVYTIVYNDKKGGK